MTEPLLEVRNIAKSFPGVQALDDVSFTLHKSEICTIAGENGAGKSTLLGILGGALTPDSGSIIIDGVRRGEYSPRRALADGIIVAHQEPAVVPQLTVVQNLLISRTRSQRADDAPHIAKALDDLKRMGFPLSPKATVGTLSPAERHALTIARSFAFGARIVALDEPTTSMLEHNVEQVLDRVREIARDRGVGVLYVSHKMAEVMSVSDTVVVLRDGRVGFRSAISETSETEIIRSMVGRQLLAFERKAWVADDAPVMFTAERIVNPRGVGPVSLDVRRGEVLGIAGLVGSGRTELLRALIRADAGSSGTVTLNGRELHIRSPRDSREAGIAFVPEDRKRQGLALQIPVFSNITLTATDQHSTLGIISRKKQIRTAERAASRMSLRPPNVKLNARQFSGGNQQKIVIARWTWRDSMVFLFDEPTKGVDVGGRVEIYELIDELAAAGSAVIVVSSDLPEIISLSDRVAVMRSGHIVAVHSGSDINEHALVASAMGVEEGTPS